MRIGINIPNELHRRMEPLKPYINISHICREAIEDRITSYEKAMETVDDSGVSQAIGRAWEEERKMRDVLNVDWWALGCEDAQAWAASGKLQDWKHLHHRQDMIRSQERPAWEVPPPHLQGVMTFNDRVGELYSRMDQEDDRFFDWLYEVHGGFDQRAAEREYMSAWLACTGSVWDLFIERRRDYMEERRRKRSERRSEGSTPVLSEALLQELGGPDPS